LLYTTEVENNNYYRKKELPRLIKSIFNYWVKIQHSDGSFDEWRKEEHGQPPTAFSLFAMSRAYVLCNEIFSTDEKNQILSSFTKAVRFLVDNEELVATNHEVVSIAALSSAQSVLKDDRELCAVVKKVLVKKVERIYKNFCSEEGWLLEIDGPDTGYNTISLAYLALYWELSEDERVVEIMKKIVEFNSIFTYPDGLAGGGTNSRYGYMNCPLGYAILEGMSSEARTSLKHFLSHVDNFVTNDRYNFPKYHRGVMFYLYLLTVLKCKGVRVEQDFRTELKDGGRVFKKANITVVNSGPVYMTVGWGATIGALYLKDHKKMVMFSSPFDWVNQGGIFAELNNGAMVSSNFKKNKLLIQAEKYRYCCSGTMFSYTRSGESRWSVRKDFKTKTRIFSILKRYPRILYLGRQLWFSVLKPLKEYLKYAGEAGYAFKRGVIFKDGSLSVTNRLTMDRQVLKGLFVQEMLYSYGSGEYEFDGGKDESGNYFCDTLLVKDKINGRKLISFHWDQKRKIVIEEMDNQAIKFAFGNVYKLRLEPDYDVKNKECMLDYQIKFYQ
jgi:hypothetical protein